MNARRCDRPNVLFIICDDLNNAIAGMGRTPCAPAPHLQRLMSQGVRFTNAHNNCPVCLPSRNSLFSGLYAHTTGQYTLWDHWRTTTPLATTGCYGRRGWGAPLLRDAVLLPRHFKHSGYRVFGAGKVLHAGVVDPAWWTDYAYGPDYGPSLGAATTERQEWMYEGEPLASYARRYEGLDRFFLDGARFRHHIETAFGPLEAIFGGRASGARHGDGSPFRYASDDDRDLLPDEKVAAWGVEVLRREHDRPFLLALGFMKPHTPLNAPSRYFDLFPPESLALPPVLAGDLDDCARALVEHRPYGFLMRDLVMKGGEALWREWLQAYLACVAFVDEQVGKVLDALDASPCRDDTLVVFTSDNGYHMGEKDYIFKDSLWEESSQVPLIVRAPGIAQRGGTCEAPVSLIDVYPTLLDLCGLPREPHADTHGRRLDGHSLRPLLDDPAAGQWEGPPVALTSARGDTGIHHSVRSRTHRYTLCQNGEQELYDHRTDPPEWHNLAADPPSRGDEAPASAGEVGPEHADVRRELRGEMMRLLWGE